VESPARSESLVRRRRSDYGSIKASERDIELLYLVGEQYAVTLPQLDRLIGRSFHTARALRDRWKRVACPLAAPFAAVVAADCRGPIMSRQDGSIGAVVSAGGLGSAPSGPKRCGARSGCAADAEVGSAREC
jgi:hypothetical protein